MNMKKIFWGIWSILIIGGGSLYAQGINWVRAIGGSNGDVGRGIAQLSTGEYLVAGVTQSFGAGQDDAFIIKLNSLGLILWSRAYGGNARDGAYDLIETSDGNYIFAGFTRSMGPGQSDVFVSKIAPDGTIIWASAVGTATLNEIANAVYECSDGSILIAGIRTVGAQDEALVAKLNSTGGLIWMRAIQGLNDDEAWDIVEALDGNYIVTGLTNTWGAGGDDAFIAKFDPSGNLIWMKVFGGGSTERGTSITNLADGGFMVGGLVESWGNGSRDMMITKFDVNGNWQWSNAIGGPNYDEGIAVDQTTDGGYAMVGNRQDPGNAWSVVSAKLDPSGGFLWGNYVGGPNFENGWGITATTDGGYAWVGESNSWGVGGDEVLAAKFISDGTNCWGQPWTPGVRPFTPNIVEINNPPISTSGAWQNINPIVTIGTFLQYEVCALYEGAHETESGSGPSLVFDGGCLILRLGEPSRVSLSLYDPSGRLIGRPIEGALLGPGQHPFSLSWLKPGVYFGRLTAGDELLTSTFIIR